MEELIRSPAALETLNPPSGRHARLVPPPRRRSHLDSASYRTLVRIFSLCLDESLNPTQEPGKDTTPVLRNAAPVVSESSSAGKDSILDRNGDGMVAEELERGGNESMECGNPRLDAASEGNLGLEEKYRNVDGNGGNGEQVKILVSEGLQPKSADDKVGALHSREEPGHQQEENAQCVDGGFQEGLVIDFKSEALEQENVCLGKVSELPSDMIFDCSELIELQDSILGSVGGSHSEVADGICEQGSSQFLVSKDQVTDLAGKSEQISRHEPEDHYCVNGTSSEALTAEFNALTVSHGRMCSSSNELMHGNGIMNEGPSDCMNESSMDLSLSKLTMLKSKEEMSNSISESVEEHHQKLLNSSTNCFVSKQLVENMVNAVLDSDNDEEIEEGQIPGDFLNSDESGPMMHQNALLEDQKVEKESGYYDFLEKGGPDCLAKVSNMDIEQSNAEMKKSYNNAPAMDVEHQAVAVNSFRSHEENSICQNDASILKAVEVRKKKKMSALTEERKAKKKKAKKRRRAEKEREQGVKRLKLQPIVKPKEIKICNFYLKGRCQQGDLCKYSHDATPLTKSQPCKYFACNSCLKGDDCPFDHQLSKYPCHNFQSNGMCHRGEKCKFSHTISTVEGSPSASIARNLVSPLTSEKLKMGKQKSMSNKLTVASDPPKITTSSTTSVSPKQLEGNLVKTAKEPMRIPNGIRFISFGNGPSDGKKLSADSLLTEKRGCGQQNPEKSLADGHKNAVCLTEKSLPKPQNESSVSLAAMKSFAVNFLKNKNSSSGSAAAPVSQNLQSEVSDASKILEEFLFGATG